MKFETKTTADADSYVKLGDKLILQLGSGKKGKVLAIGVINQINSLNSESGELRLEWEPVHLNKRLFSFLPKEISVGSYGIETDDGSIESNWVLDKKSRHWTIRGVEEGLDIILADRSGDITWLDEAIYVLKKNNKLRTITTTDQSYYLLHGELPNKAKIIGIENEDEERIIYFLVKYIPQKLCGLRGSASTVKALSSVEKGDSLFRLSYD